MWPNGVQGMWLLVGSEMFRSQKKHRNGHNLALRGVFTEATVTM